MSIEPGFLSWITSDSGNPKSHPLWSSVKELCQERYGEWISPHPTILICEKRLPGMLCREIPKTVSGSVGRKADYYVCHGAAVEGGAEYT